jgi:hypothetical protein
MEKKTLETACEEMIEYLRETDFDNEYVETIYEYLMNKKIKVI